ncbi:hypothetical protein GCM10009745_01690 [Kribbella yunnanensis]|uniref:Phage tail protein n=1 Tax=Kribbella yunnanensis TaxID=190194 RepID=A0ABP4RZP8_9ACTN
MVEPVEEFAASLDTRAVPAIGVWNRVEGRPRTTEFGAALRAEVRDPLWMLTRQWQLGEFLGSDAGTPVTAQFSVATTTPTRYRPGGGGVEPISGTAPLEAVAERRVLPFDFGSDPVSFDLRLAMGRRWLKYLRNHPNLLVRGFRNEYIKKYPIALPDPGKAADAARVAHPEVWAQMQAVAGRAVDGYKLYRFLKGGGKAWQNIDGVTFLTKPALETLGNALMAWFDELLEQPVGVDAAHPNGNSAWDAGRLEHNFSIAARAGGTGEKVLTAQEYPGGTLDWHAFSVDTRAPLGGTVDKAGRRIRTTFPAPVRFSGMPLPRWWAVEDGKTNFAAVKPDSTDLARLIFLEYALVYSNDWFQVPCELPVGTIADVEGLVVTDVFGTRQWISAAGTGREENWQRWSMYGMDTIGTADVAADTSLFLPASVPKIAEGPPLEDVLLIRDEMANMVWGIEQTIPLVTGKSRRGAEVVAEELAFRQSLPATTPPGVVRKAPEYYEVMSSVPENWIPFIAVREPGSERRIRLQRASMPSVVDGSPVKPRTDLLRENLDGAGPKTYFIAEEEVPASGTRLTVAYNRTRWRNGRAVTWLSAKRTSGRGEGSSGLAFDHLVDTPPAP